jgi:hypothetical protein
MLQVHAMYSLVKVPYHTMRGMILYIRNLIKYAHSAPKSNACHLVGFLPLVSSPAALSKITLNISHQLPNKIKDVLSTMPCISKSSTATLHTHC